MSDVLVHDHPCLTRRDLVRGGLAGVGVMCLAACNRSPQEAPPDDQSADPQTTGPADGENGADTGENGADDSSGVIAAVEDIPLGGALAAELDGAPILLTRVDEETVAAFSAICTHEGCQVQPGEGELACPCHGSRYDLAEAAVLGGPAPQPLPPVEVEVVDGQVVGPS